MKQPNPYSANVISFMSVLPEEFKVNSYIDYDIQFEKVFVDPLILIVNSINWKIDTTYGTQGTLEDFF